MAHRSIARIITTNTDQPTTIHRQNKDMRRTPNAGRWGAAAAPLLPLLLAAALPWARAVQLYYGLDELTDLQKVGIVDKQGTVQRHTLLSFSNNRCRAAASHKMGFPWNYMHLPGEEFELGQVSPSGRDRQGAAGAGWDVGCMNT